MAADFAAMALEMHQDPGVEQTLDHVVDFARRSVGCDHVGVMLLHGGKRLEMAATTDPIVEKADAFQVDLGQGPCLESMDDHEVLLVVDTATETRWPDWCARVSGLGLRSVLSARLFTTRATIGSLNLYDTRPGHFDAVDATVAGIFARHASVALAAACSESTLRQAMDARHLIGQAQGILMERFKLSGDQAFCVLRRYSQDRNVKLRVVAEELVAHRTLPG